MKRQILGILSGLACSLGASSAFAANHVQPWLFSDGNWTLVPIVQSGTTTTVDSFLAIAAPNLTTGDNIVAIWYRRDPASPSIWHSWSWQTSSRTAAICSVKQTLGLIDQDDYAWPDELGRELWGLCGSADAVAVRIWRSGGRSNRAHSGGR